MNKKKLRTQIRQLRRDLPENYRRQCSYKFSERFALLEPYQSAKRVAGLLPFDGEADPTPLMDRAILEGKEVFVPIIIAKDQPLLFAPWTRQTKLKQNGFGILEPDVPRESMIAARELDFVITPLVAFDENCNRVGVGGGYYDRSFSFRNTANIASDHQAHMVGIAYELQRVDRFPTEDWDVRLDAVVTESKVWLAGSS